MVNYWKEKVLPKIKKVFEKNGVKKAAAAAEATKAFDEAKEGYTKEFEDKKTELQPKVVEIYEATSTEVKGLIKTPKDSGLKKHATAVQKFLDELVKIEFPGSKVVSEASSKFGPGYVSGPISFVFEKVSTFIVVEEKTEEPPAAAAEAGTTMATEETSTAVKEKEIVVEGEKKEEAPAPEAAASEEKTEAAVAEAPAPATTEATKVEEAAAPAAETPKA